eukprot:643871-Prorocentrum_minimum.AAC.2
MFPQVHLSTSCVLAAPAAHGLAAHGLHACARRTKVRATPSGANLGGCAIHGSTYYRHRSVTPEAVHHGLSSALRFALKKFGHQNKIKRRCVAETQASQTDGHISKRTEAEKYLNTFSTQVGPCVTDIVRDSREAGGGCYTTALNKVYSPERKPIKDGVLKIRALGARLDIIVNVQLSLG